MSPREHNCRICDSYVPASKHNPKQASLCQLSKQANNRISALKDCPANHLHIGEGRPEIPVTAEEKKLEMFYGKREALLELIDERVYAALQEEWERTKKAIDQAVEYQMDLAVRANCEVLRGVCGTAERNSLDFERRLLQVEQRLNAHGDESRMTMVIGDAIVTATYSPQVPSGSPAFTV